MIARKVAKWMETKKAGPIIPKSLAGWDELKPALERMLGSVGRDYGYEYGNILPFRKPVSGGEAEWGLGYSGLAKSIYDAFTAPGMAYQGEELGPEDAMNFAMNMAGGGFATGKVPKGSLGMNVYHGSPHKFDAFDMAKIGTGEGAQAYGHGLYFAENPSVAKSYRDSMSESGGALYKVDIPDASIAKMLDWDKPLSQQSESVREALRSVRWSDPKLIDKFWNKPARDFYKYLERRPNSGAAEASKTLNTFGVPGIRYLDEGSRGQGAGTSNFVVFDDQIPKIIGRE